MSASGHLALFSELKVFGYLTSFGVLKPLGDFITLGALELFSQLKPFSYLMRSGIWEQLYTEELLGYFKYSCKMLTILDKNDTWLSTIIPEYIPKGQSLKNILTNLQKRTQGQTRGTFKCPTAITSSDINMHGQPTETSLSLGKYWTDTEIQRLYFTKCSKVVSSIYCVITCLLSRVKLNRVCV